MNPDQVRSRLIDVLAEKRGRDRGELEAELLAGGVECAYDSIWLVKAGARVARELGFRLRPPASERRAFKSVGALAAYLSARAAEREAA
jgi:acyl carrier protein